MNVEALTCVGPDGSFFKMVHCCDVEFALHVSLRKHVSDTSNVVDITEARLLNLARHCSAKQRALLLVALASDYRDGHVAVSWKHGMPVFFRVHDDV